MQRLCALLSILILASLLTGCAASPYVQSQEIEAMESSQATTDMPAVLPHDPHESCPITKAPVVPFVPPEPYPSKPPERYANQFWYGTPELWTMLGTDATWRGLPHNHGYSQKVFWWSKDFDSNIDPFPAFMVTIEQLDAGTPSSPIIVAKEATNASADFGTAMLTGVSIPEPGCWKITGQYKQAELSFVVQVTP